MRIGSSDSGSRASAAATVWIRRVTTNKELGWTAIAQALAVLQSLVQVKILTTFLGKAEYGEWALLLSLSLLVGMLPFSALDQGVAKVRGEQPADGENGLFRRVVGVYVAIFAVWLLVIVCASGVAGLEVWSQSLPLLAYALTEVLRNAVVSYNNAARERRTVALHRAWDLVAKSTALLALASTGLLETTSVLWALSLVNAIGLILFAKRHRKTNDVVLTPLRELLRSVGAFSWPLAVWALFGWFQPMISRWYLTEWATREAVASFAVLVSVAMFMPNFIYTVFASYLLPVLYGRPGPLPSRQYLRMTAMFGVVLGVYTLLTMPAAGLLVTVLTDQKYRDLAAYVPWVTASTSLYFIASLYASELFRAGATKKLLLPTIAPGFLAVTLGLVLVPQYGLRGAIGIFILGHLIYAVAAVSVTFKYLTSRVEKRTE